MEVGTTTIARFLTMCELPKIYDRRTVKCRKPKRCCECFGPIAVGERYERHSGLWDDWRTYAQCEDCARIADQVMASLDTYDVLPFGGLIEHVFEDQDVALMTEYVAILQRRNPKTVADWMLELTRGPTESGQPDNGNNT